MAITPDFTFEVHGLVVVFRGTATGDPVNRWRWDFGDGGLDLYQNVTHKYSASGTVDITLYARNSSLVEYPVTKSVNVLRDIRFRCYPSNDNPLEIQFVDTSEPVIGLCQWAWDFGDGESSSSQNPSHTYATKGAYEVTLSTLYGSWVCEINVNNPSATMLAIVNDGHILKSIDNGLAWDDLGLLVEPYTDVYNGMDTAHSLINFGGGIIVAVTGKSFIERSEDYGETWTQIPIDYLSNHNQEARSGISLGCGRGLIGGFHWNPTCNNMILGSILLTTDFGVTWICKTSSYNYTSFLSFKSFANHSVIIALRAVLLSTCSAAASNTQLAVSRDYGNTWTFYGPSPIISYSSATPADILALLLPDGAALTPRTLSSQLAYSQPYSTPPLPLLSDLTVDRMYWSSGGKLLASANTYLDNMEWTLQTIPLSRWIGMAFGAGVFVAVAYQSIGVDIFLVYSPDGINWTPIDPQPAALTGVVYANGVFIAVGSGSYTVIMSPDGINWSAGGDLISIVSPRIVFGNGVFVVYYQYSTSEPTEVSVDGLSWNVSPDSLPSSDIDIIFAIDRFYRFREDGSIYTSTDGLAWSLFSSFPEVLSYVTYGNGMFVAIPDLAELGDQYFYSSPDAINWTARPVDQYCVWTGVTFVNGLFIALSDGYKVDGVMTSSDGITWVSRYLPTGGYAFWLCTAFGNGTYVSVGSQSTFRAMTSPGIVPVANPTPILHISDDRGATFSPAIEGFEAWSFSDAFGGVQPPGPSVGILANTNIITYQDKDVGFSSIEPVAGNEIHNCLLKNFGGLMHLNHLPEDVFACILDEDPEFTDVEIIQKIDNVDAVMSGEFEPKKTTPCLDMGNNSFVSDVPTDVLGNDRIYDDGVVDIGPYELTILNIELTSGDLQSIFQEKLNWDVGNPLQFLPSYGDAIYNDIAVKMVDNIQREEFAREAKIVIVLKKLRVDYKTRSDKMNDPLLTVEAYYDNTTQSIICYKFHDKIGDMLSKFFEDDRYVIYFNEAENELTFYLNKTYDKGLSGHRNVIKNVRFGGSPVLIG